MNNIKIQLVDTNIGYLDVVEGSNFPLTFGVAEIRDISKRKGTTSKTIKLSGSKNNNILLNNYFDVNVVAETFNINILQKCIVLEDNIPILENAYLQLVNVKKVQSSGRHEQLVEYEVLIKDNISDFYTSIDGKLLSDLDFSGFNHVLSAANVVSTFGNDVNDVYKYVMPGTGDTEYLLTEWRPGIYAKQYWDRIFSNAGFQYEWSSMTASDINFDKLIIPYNGDAPKLTQDEQELYKVQASIASTYSYYGVGATGSNIGFINKLYIDNEIVDNSNLYNPVLSKYNNFIQTATTDTLNINFEIAYKVNLNNLSGGIAYLQDNGLLDITGFKYTPKLFVYKNGAQTSFNLNLKVGGNPYITKQQGYSIPNGITTIDSNTVNLSLAISNLVPGDILEIYVGLVVQPFNIFANAYWRNASSGTSNVRVDAGLVISSLKMDIQPSLNTFGYASVVDLNKFIPANIKQSDFIKSIMTMYNLYIDVNKSYPNKLVVKTRDDYYDSGAIVDWTKKLSKDKEQLLRFLPELSSKKVLLTYKADEDYANKGYLENVKEVYGQQDFTFDSEYVKGIDKKELVFSPTPIMDTPFGAIVPILNGSAPKNNIRILYDAGTWSCGNYNIYDYKIGNVGYGATLSYYPLFSHFDNPTKPTFDINFGVCDYYFYSGLENLTNNNLYNLHWRRTLNQLNKNKILTAYFNLLGSDINKMNLNDKIRIDNSYWNINNIIDYNPTKIGPTKVELLSIDDELKLSPFKTRPISRPTGKGDIVLKPVISIVKDIIKDRNVIASSKIDIIGTGNVIQDGVSGSIVGNDNIIGSGKVSVSGDGNTISGDAIVVGDRNIVKDGVKAVIFGNDIKASDSGVLYTNDIRVVDGSVSVGTMVVGTSGVVFNNGYFIDGYIDEGYVGFTGVSGEFWSYDDINFETTLDIVADNLLNNGREIVLVPIIGVATASGVINSEITLVDTSIGSFTMSLPSAVDYLGKTYIIKDKGGNANINNIIIDGFGSELIDGSSNYIMRLNYESITLVSDNNSWWII